MSARLVRTFLLLATSALGCAASVGAGAGGGGVGAGARADVSGGSGRPDERTCMFDRASGQLRTCLHFSFGRCAAFGDRCSKGSRGPPPEQGAPPASPAPHGVTPQP